MKKYLILAALGLLAYPASVLASHPGSTNIDGYGFQVCDDWGGIYIKINPNCDRLQDGDAKPEIYLSKDPFPGNVTKGNVVAAWQAILWADNMGIELCGKNRKNGIDGYFGTYTANSTKLWNAFYSAGDSTLTYVNPMTWARASHRLQIAYGGLVRYPGRKFTFYFVHDYTSRNYSDYGIKYPFGPTLGTQYDTRDPVLPFC